MEREQTTIRLPAELKEQLQQEADQKGFPLKDFITFILVKYMDRSPSENHHQEALV